MSVFECYQIINVNYKIIHIFITAHDMNLKRIKSKGLRLTHDARQDRA